MPRKRNQQPAPAGESTPPRCPCCTKSDRVRLYKDQSTHGDGTRCYDWFCDRCIGWIQRWGYKPVPEDYPVDQCPARIVGLRQRVSTL